MNHSVLLVINLNELSKSAAIVIVRGLRVAESLEYRSGAEDRLLDAAAMRSLLAERRQMMQEEIRRLGLAGAAFAADDDALVLLLLEHAVVSGVGDRENVRRYVRTQPTILVKLDVLRIVDRIELERIQGYKDAADVSVDVAGKESSAKIVQERLFVEIGQLTEVRILLVARLIQEAVEVVLQELRVHRESTGRPQVIRLLFSKIKPARTTFGTGLVTDVRL